MRILGINAYHGDASACLVEGGDLIAAAAEERFNRMKHCAGFPKEAIRYCLDEAHLSLGDVDIVAVSRNPFRNLHRKLFQAVRLAGRNPASLFERAASARAVGRIRAELDSIYPRFGLPRGTRIFHVEHHLAHAASAFFVSPFEEAAILSMDGFGDYSSTLLAHGRGNRITELHRVHFPHSLGLVYNALTQYLGFPHYGDEGKVMALAALGKPQYLEAFRGIVMDDSNQSFVLNLDFFDHQRRGVAMNWASGQPEVGRLYSAKLEKFLGPARAPGAVLDQRLYDIAASLQARTEEVILRLASGLHQKAPSPNICLAGGVALNCLGNTLILDKTPFEEVFVQPAAADDGTAIGAAFYAHHQLEGGRRSFVMEHAGWGPGFSDREIDRALEGAGLQVEATGQPEIEAAKALAEGKVVGWFQGRMEFGPRALGFRSILADPRKAEMKKVLNDRVKHREPFRPFAPSILEDKTGEYFEKSYPSPFMLMAYAARKDRAAKLAAALHVDGTGRLQTVTEKQNPRYWRLIREFEKLSGVPVVLNTSFNDSEPIVCTPQDALNCFKQTRMDLLVLGNRLVRKNESDYAKHD